MAEERAEQNAVEATMQALEAQRKVLGDAVVDASLDALRQRLSAMRVTDAAAARPLQTLRQVTILFMDVVGSTTLARRLPIEDAGAVMDGLLARSTAAVEHQGGKVLQYAGDNVLAVFGADGAREDDAERAVRCGLALLELGRVVGAEVLAAHGHDGLAVRAGAHTGGVLLGGGVDADNTIRGLAVSIAARMEQSAPAGALRISQDTHALVRGLFDVEAQPPLAVKGLDEPVHSVLVRGIRPLALRVVRRGIEGVATRMVGRDTEFAALQAVFQRLFLERRLALVTLVADAGIGKSRLLHEFAAWSASAPWHHHRLQACATPQSGARPYGLLRDLLARHCQLADDDRLDAARRKLEQGLMPLFEAVDDPAQAQANAHLLGHLVGVDWRDSPHIRGIVDDARQIRSRGLHAALQLLRGLVASDGAPVLLQLEDLHWADDESLDFLRQLDGVAAELPLLLLASTRPALFERRADWRRAEGVQQRITLAPLDTARSGALADELLQRLPAVPAALRALLIARAEGNPFFMEELVRMLVDQRAITTGPTWALDTDRLQVTQVPATLTGVLQARLDALPAAERRALQQASIVGAVFWDHALSAVDAQAAAQLPALVQRELVLPRPDAPAEGLREYAFRHALLHEVVYDTVLRRDKRLGHARVAQWLAVLTAQGGPRAGDLLGAAAEHFERASDAGAAAEFHARAAEQAGHRLAHERARQHVERGLALLDALQPDPPELRWRLLRARERALGVQSLHGTQVSALEAMTRLAEQLDDDRKRAEVALLRGTRALRMSDYTEAGATSREALACAARVGDDDMRLRAVRLMAAARNYAGDLEGSRALALEGLAESRRLGLAHVQALLLNQLAITAYMQGDPMGYLDLTRQGLGIRRQLGDRVNEAINLCNLGGAWLGVGDRAQARQTAASALAMARSNGDRVTELDALRLNSDVALVDGDAPRALQLAQAALEIATAVGSPQAEILAALRIGAATLVLGRLVESRQAYVRAQAQAQVARPALQHDACAGLARVALAQDDTEAALRALQPLLDHAAAGGSLDGAEDQRRVELTCFQVLQRVGDPGAADWLRRAHAALMTQAQAIADAAAQRAFLRDIPHHHAILAAWEGQARSNGTLVVAGA